MFEAEYRVLDVLNQARINGGMPMTLIANYPSKKDAKAAVGQPLKYIETSLFEPEFKPDGKLTVANRPHITHKGREWFGIITMKNGLIDKVE